MQDSIKRHAVKPLILAMSLAVLVPAMHSATKGSIEAQSAATTFVSQATPLASIDLYNPTAWTAPVAVEVPVVALLRRG